MSMAATAHEDVSFERENCDFVSHGVDCAGWLYRPAESENPPVIIMAHGLAACRSYGLPTFAERFAAEGYAVFVFDYRGFGDSAGEWRNNVDVNRHGEDWDAAIAHVKTLPGIDAERIILWARPTAARMLFTLHPATHPLRPWWHRCLMPVFRKVAVGSHSATSPL